MPYLDAILGSYWLGLANIFNLWSSATYASSYNSTASAQNASGSELVTHSALEQLLEGATGDERPSFVTSGYPAIYGGTGTQAAQVWSILAAIPAEDREAVHSIHVGPFYTTAAFQVTAHTLDGREQNYGEIYLNTADLLDPERARMVVLHETGHAVAIYNGVLQGSTRQVWSGPNLFGDAAARHPGEPVNEAAETFADAYAAYYGGQATRLLAAAPDQYNALASGAYKGRLNVSFIDLMTGSFNWMNQHVWGPLGAAFLTPAYLGPALYSTVSRLGFTPSWWYQDRAQESFALNRLLALNQVEAATVNAGPPPHDF